MPSPRFPIPKGSLDMQVLRTLSPEPAGCGIAQRLEQKHRRRAGSQQSVVGKARFPGDVSLVFEEGNQ